MKSVLSKMVQFDWTTHAQIRNYCQVFHILLGKGQMSSLSSVTSIDQKVITNLITAK